MLVPSRRAPWWAYWRHMPPREDEPAPAASTSSRNVNSSSSGSVDGGAVAPGEAAPHVNPEDMRELPGLHSRGLLNLFRVLLPESSQPTSSSSGGGSSSSNSSSSSSVSSGMASSNPVGTPASTGANGSQAVGITVQQGAAAAPGAPPTGPAPRTQAAGDCGCSHAHPEGKEWQYVQRCATGQLEGGAKLSRFAPGQFDTVVDTFGLCSHEDPVQVRAAIGSWGRLAEARACVGGARWAL